MSHVPVPGMAVPDVAAGVPIISTDRLGVEFYRSRKRRMNIREILLEGKNTASRDTFWALKDVTVDIMPGEAVGLIGANGGGKSTLLKCIAGVLIPDEGSVAVRGGVAPMIALTGGFLSELSARENIYLTASLHGLTKSQIDARFDDIVGFAGDQVAVNLDMPYRHFSSGMQARLGFAVITALDEPIILVDEVLAVGDAVFREKCYQRMEALLAQGKTLFLVSHAENDLKRFCTRGLYVRKGHLEADGPLLDVIKQYNEDQKGAK